MKKPLLFLATGNPGNAREFRELLGDLYTVLAKSEVGLDDFAIPEIGETLEENAYRKAEAIFRAAQQIGYGTSTGLADDTGLFVSALQGAPGVHSARYAGEHASDAENVALLLQKMEDVPEAERSAYFETVLVLVNAKGRRVVRGRLDGMIGWEVRGAHGFGYDGIFQVDGCTLAEREEEEKNAISHRAKALRALRELGEKKE